MYVLERNRKPAKRVSKFLTESRFVPSAIGTAERRPHMPPTDFLMSSPANGTFQVAMVLLVGLFMGLWSTMTGKGP
jgi:hypothetical protein